MYLVYCLRPTRLTILHQLVGYHTILIMIYSAMCYMLCHTVFVWFYIVMIVVHNYDLILCILYHIMHHYVHCFNIVIFLCYIILLYFVIILYSLCLFIHLQFFCVMLYLFSAILSRIRIKKRMIQ